MRAAPITESPFYLLWFCRTTVLTHPLKTPKSLGKATPIGQPAPSPHLIGYCTAGPALSAPQIPAAERQSKWKTAGKAASRFGLGAWGSQGALDESSRLAPPRKLRCYRTTARAAALPQPWVSRSMQRIGLEKRSVRQAGVAHTTEASPDTEATLLSSAQGCRFCSAKRDELCRQSGSGGSGGRSGRGSASCCRCRSSRPARCRSASRSSAVWRLDGRRYRIGEGSPPPNPPPSKPRPQLVRPVIPPRPAPHRHLVRRFWNHVLT